MASTAIFDDLELVLTQALRAPLQASHDVLVTNRQVATQRAFTVVVRGDGGPTRMATAVHRVGIRVLGPGDDWQATGDLARLVSAILHTLPGQLSIVDVDNVSTPYRVSDAPRPEFYLTGEVTLAGRAFTPPHHRQHHQPLRRRSSWPSTTTATTSARLVSRSPASLRSR